MLHLEQCLFREHTYLSHTEQNLHKQRNNKKYASYINYWRNYKSYYKQVRVSKWYHLYASYSDRRFWLRLNLLIMKSVNNNNKPRKYNKNIHFFPVKSYIPSITRLFVWKTLLLTRFFGNVSHCNIQDIQKVSTVFNFSCIVTHLFQNVIWKKKKNHISHYFKMEKKMCWQFDWSVFHKTDGQWAKIWSQINPGVY